VTSERGSVSILALGLLAVCLLTLGVVVDLGALQLQHRRALATADAAARAAAQGLDLDAYYHGTGGRVLPLDAGAARMRARAYLARTGNAWRLERLSLPGRSVQVQVSQEVRLPFSAVVLDDSVTVRATGTAELRELPGSVGQVPSESG
jgi:uncharacterized membrane protein